jgi:hypothetical protein
MRKRSEFRQPSSIAGGLQTAAAQVHLSDMGCRSTCGPIDGDVHGVIAIVTGSLRGVGIGLPAVLVAVLIGTTALSQAK